MKLVPGNMREVIFRFMMLVQGSIRKRYKDEAAMKRQIKQDKTVIGGHIMGICSCWGRGANRDNVYDLNNFKPHFVPGLWLLT